MFPLKEKYSLAPTKVFEKNVEKEVKKDPHLKKKISKTLDSLQRNPFQGKKIRHPKLPEWRIHIGRSHRLFYDLDGNKIVLLQMKPKSKRTYN